MQDRYTLEYHPQRAQIQRDILAGVPNTRIAKKYSTSTVKISTDAVRRYKQTKLPMMLRHAELEEVDGIVNRINEYLDTVEQFYNSIRKVLDNPESPGEVCYYPTAEEVKIKFFNDATNKWEVDTLQHLLSSIEKKAPIIKGVYVNGKDPREYLLRTAETLNKQLETISRVKGYIAECGDTTVNIASGNVEDIANIAREALAPYPEALDAFVSALLAEADKQDSEAQKAATEGR